MHQEEVQEEPKLTPLIPPEAFINVFEAGDPGMVEYEVEQAQQCYHRILEQWERNWPIKRNEGPGKTVWVDKEG
jgi:hypothetical protein